MSEVERQTLNVDIACVGFGPAMGGFLTTLSRGMLDENGQPLCESSATPGMPPQVICYERADDLGFGVSGVVTRARGIRESYPEIEQCGIPMSCPVKEEKVVYLLDPLGASRRSAVLGVADRLLGLLPLTRDQAFELPWIPPFLRKEPGMLFSIGQFNQWAASQVMGSGLVQIWPGMPVAEPLIENNKVLGVRLADQGVNKAGEPDSCYMPGMDINAALTVVGDGPVGAIGQQLDDHFGLPAGHHQRDWAVGMKMVVELPENCELQPGTVIHTLGYPEPELFGFMYVYPDRLASLGIFVPSWFDNPVRTAYRYLQHWMMHPYLWRHLAGGTMRSWGAKSLQESGIEGEPFLAGDGYARIGECSGSTNVLANSGVDEAWATGSMLAEAVLELMKAQKPFTRENLEGTYVSRRRASWLQKEALEAKSARAGFQKGFITGMLGTALSGLTGGLCKLPFEIKRPHERIRSMQDYFAGRFSDPKQLDEIIARCQQSAQPLHDSIMTELGWPEIPFDGKLLVSHQDALLMGGKVQAAPGYADHVRFANPGLCENCGTRICIEACSGQAIMPGEKGVPQFDREKCIHCGACLWNCASARSGNPERSNVLFSAGSGGLHSAEN